MVAQPGVSFANLNPANMAAIDALLDAGAIISCEFYYRQIEDYCQRGTTAGARDIWLGDKFHGERGATGFPRFDWLAKRKVARNSGSPLTVVFGVTDQPPIDYLNGPSPAVFLDRLFYVWGYPFQLQDVSSGREWRCGRVQVGRAEPK